jgi:KDO2-lipid IV(A) lauroyltransferase
MSSSDASSRLHDKSPLRRKTEQLVIRWITGAAALLARVLPLRSLQALGNAMGSLLFRLLKPRREIALANLERVFGDRYDRRERERIINFSVRNMAKTMLELLKAGWLSEEQLREFVQIRGEEHLRQAVERGKGVVVITGHFGNWELLAATVGRLGYDLAVIARDANDQNTANIINRAREAAVAEVLPRESVREMLRVLREGKILGILPDQHTERGGIWLPFMGHLACTAPGPATLAQRTGSPIVPAFARRTEDDRLDLYFLPPIEVPDTGDRQQDIRTATRLINDALSAEIMAHPEQWIWMHRRWRQPPAEVLEDNALQLSHGGN